MKEALDRIDFALLTLLQNNARLTNKELASHVGLAPSSCLSRVQRLHRLGVMTGAHAEVNLAALGIGLQAVVAVKLREHSRPRVRSFWQYLVSLPCVLATYHVTGAHDFLVHVAARDGHHLRDLAMDVFATRPEVAHLETSLIFQYARNTAPPNYTVEAETGGAVTPDAPKAAKRPSKSRKKGAAGG